MTEEQAMNPVVKYIMDRVLIIGLIGGLLYGVGIYWKSTQAADDKWQKTYQEKLDEQNRSFLKLADNLIRAQTTQVTKEELLEVMKQKTDPAILELIKQNREQTRQVGEIVGKLNTTVEKYVAGAKHYVPDEAAKKEREYYFTKIYRKVGAQQIPVAWAMFYPHKPEGERWKRGTYDWNFNAIITQTEQPSGGTNNYAELYMTTCCTEEAKDTDGNFIEIPIKAEKVEFQYVRNKEKRFHAWAPRLNLGLDVGYADGGTLIGPSLGFSTMSYGKTVVDADWKFLTLSAGGNTDDFWATLAPVSVNLSHYLPLISDLYFEPFIGHSWGDHDGIAGGARFETGL
jgi:hypothetical protein